MSLVLLPVNPTSPEDLIHPRDLAVDYLAVHLVRQVDEQLVLVSRVDGLHVVGVLVDLGHLCLVDVTGNRNLQSNPLPDGHLTEVSNLIAYLSEMLLGILDILLTGVLIGFLIEVLDDILTLVRARDLGTSLDWPTTS